MIDATAEDHARAQCFFERFHIVPNDNMREAMRTMFAEARLEQDTNTRMKIELEKALRQPEIGVRP